VQEALHPYAGVISALGFAVAFLTFIYHDVIEEELKDTVVALQTAGRAYDAKLNADNILEKLSNVEGAKTAPSVESATASIRRSAREEAVRIMAGKSATNPKDSPGTNKSNPYTKDTNPFYGPVNSSLPNVTTESNDPLSDLTNESLTRLTILYESLPKSG
jgi:hypothetical protein